MISRERAVALLEAFGRCRLLVVGDLMLDRYIVGRVERISPEAPVPVVHVTHEKARPGGAANVALNIQALGGQAVVAGVAGKDADGEALVRMLNDAGADTSAVHLSTRLPTTVKTRVVAERQQVVRVDREAPPEAFADPMAEVAGVIAARAGEVSAIVIEDYGKGAVTQQTVDACAEAAGRYGIELGLDPKDNHELRIGGMTTATPNYREACAAAGVRERQLDALPDPAAHLQDVAQRLLERWGARFVVITLGAHGMFVTGRGRPPLMIPTRAREVFDVSGAGDTVIATVMLALAAGASEAEAASLSNYAAGVVVGKLGTATCTPGELLGFMDAVRAAPSPPSTA